VTCASTAGHFFTPGDCPELELLLACVRPDSGSDAGARRIETLLQQDIDWTLLIRTALAHGVSPLVAERLGRLTSDALPTELRAALADHLLDNRERNVLLVNALFELLDALRSRDIVALPFKGQTLAALANGDSTLRRAGDLDVLLRPDDLAEAWKALESLGYRELTEAEIGRPMNAAEHAGYLRYQCEYAFLRRSDGIVVEPHWAIAPTTMAIDLDYERFWSRAATVVVNGRSLLTLGLADLLLVLCVHGSKHEWARLQWICDVAALTERQPELDLAAILEEARSRGLARMLLLGLGLAQRMLGARMPAAIVQSLEADPAAAHLIERIAQRLFLGDPETSAVSEVSRLRIAMRERRRDRAKYIVRTVLTPTEKHLRICELPLSLSALYVPLKLAHDYVAMPAWRLWRRVVPARRAT